MNLTIVNNTKHNKYPTKMSQKKFSAILEMIGIDWTDCNWLESLQPIEDAEFYHNEETQNYQACKTWPHKNFVPIRSDWKWLEWLELIVNATNPWKEAEFHHNHEDQSY